MINAGSLQERGTTSGDHRPKSLGCIGVHGGARPPTSTTLESGADATRRFPAIRMTATNSPQESLLLAARLLRAAADQAEADTRAGPTGYLTETGVKSCRGFAVRCSGRISTWRTARTIAGRCGRCFRRLRLSCAVPDRRLPGRRGRCHVRPHPQYCRQPNMIDTPDDLLLLEADGLDGSRSW